MIHSNGPTSILNSRPLLSKVSATTAAPLHVLSLLFLLLVIPFGSLVVPHSVVGVDAVSTEQLETKTAQELLDMSKRFLMAGQKTEALQALDVAISRDPADYLTIFRRAGSTSIKLIWFIKLIWLLWNMFIIHIICLSY